MDIDVLLQLSLFRGMVKEQVSPFLFATSHVSRSYKVSDFIAKEGELYRSPFFLYSGTVQTQMIAPDGKQLTVAVIEAPSLLAPAFIFASENRFPVNIQAVEKCEILIVNRDTFLNFMHTYPQAMRNFLQNISDHSLFLSQKLNAFALQSLKSRLLDYVKSHGGIENKQEAARILGVARPSLARALSELLNEKCLEIKGKKMIVNEANIRKYM